VRNLAATNYFCAHSIKLKAQACCWFAPCFYKQQQQHPLEIGLIFHAQNGFQFLITGMGIGDNQKISKSQSE
jgi:hypothetical protein